MDQSDDARSEPLMDCKFRENSAPGVILMLGLIVGFGIRESHDAKSVGKLHGEFARRGNTGRNLAPPPDSLSSAQRRRGPGRGGADQSILLTCSTAPLPDPLPALRCGARGKSWRWCQVETHIARNLRFNRELEMKWMRWKLASGWTNVTAKSCLHQSHCGG